MKKVKIGFIGCGTISAIYLKNCTTVFSDILEVAACADINMDLAKQRAREFNVPVACTVEELLANPEIEIVVNLTIPKAHYDVCMAALNAGKSVYVEKPLATTREKGMELVKKAAEKGLLVGGAPDTFLGAGLQTCRRLIDEGAIGTPVAVTTFRTGHGPEDWHPNPEFYYKEGAGPVFDMGPYDLTALISLVGPVAGVMSSAKITFPQRTITSQPKFGNVIDVETPTHVTSILTFENGVVGTFLSSFDMWAAKLPYIEIYGTEGSLNVPDPNTFGGPISLYQKGDKEWREIAVPQTFAQDSRGLGVADMAYSLRCGTNPRANGGMTYHVLDVMQSMLDSAKTQSFCKVGSTCERPRSFNGSTFD